MKKPMRNSLLAICFVLAFPLATYADEIIYADKVTQILRGGTPGNFSGFYGGQWDINYPAPLTVDQANAAVLGAPDNSFLSLPGGVPGTTPAYVEVGFATNFYATDTLYITEDGAEGTSARLSIFALDGAKIETTLTHQVNTDMTGALIVDLSSFATFMNSHGGSFNRIGLQGMDQYGASWGFDLDAIGVKDPVSTPEPATMLLLGSGLVGLVGFRNKLKK